MMPRLWTPFDPDHIQNPYWMYKALRAQDPVHLSQTGEWIITRYDDIKRILKDPAFVTGNRLEWIKRGVRYFENKDEDLTAISVAMNSFILMLNPPGHTRIRNFVAQFWDERVVDSILQKNVSELLAELPEGEIDIVARFAQPLPVLTISHLLGITTNDYNTLKELGITMTKTMDLYLSLKELVSISDAAKKLIAFFRDQIRQKYYLPDRSLLGQMVSKNSSEKDPLSEEELISIAIFLFIAGAETSSSLISSGLLNLLKHPDQVVMLRNNNELTASALEEMIRYDSPVQLLGRIAAKNYEIDDRVIPAGATLTLVLGSANRDETIFDRADEFMITRKPNRHLSFGSGIHYCMGDWLARRQAQLAINCFLKKFRCITLPDQEFTWYRNLSIRRLNSLRVVCTK